VVLWSAVIGAPVQGFSVAGRRQEGASSAQRVLRKNVQERGNLRSDSCGGRSGAGVSVRMWFDGEKDGSGDGLLSAWSNAW
jgi:hypothetical protein